MPGAELYAIVPMRHSSERVRGKNYRVLGDAPLFHHVVRTLLAVPEVTRVVIDTDSDVIRQQTEAAFDEVVVLERPEHLRAGETPMTEVLAHTVIQLDGDRFLQTHSTNPFLRPDTVSAAIAALASSSVHDSLFSVTRLQTRLYDADGGPVNHDPAVLLRTQDLPPLYEENSNLYLFDRATIATGRRIGDRPMMFEMDALEAVDIDAEADWRIAEALWQLRQEALTP